MIASSKHHPLHFSVSAFKISAFTRALSPFKPREHEEEHPLHV